jgi:AcrR family transcriptional regulator
MVIPTERKSADERRDEILDAAMVEFAERGLHGGSTEEIAKRAGISQPYVFRLFGSKKDLFKAAVARCLRETLETFQRAAEGKRGEEALHAMGEAYMQLLADRSRLRAQGSFPGADQAFERALALPFHSRLVEADLDQVGEALDKLVSNH